MVLGVNAWDEPKSQIRRFVKKSNLKHRILLNGSAVADQYGISSVPTLIFINREGVMIDAELGFHGVGPLLKKTRLLLRGSG